MCEPTHAHHSPVPALAAVGVAGAVSAGSAIAIPAAVWTAGTVALVVAVVVAVAVIAAIFAGVAVLATGARRRPGRVALAILGGGALPAPMLAVAPGRDRTRAIAPAAVTLYPSAVMAPGATTVPAARPRGRGE
jgi:hypothetical protein